VIVFVVSVFWLLVFMASSRFVSRGVCSPVVNPLRTA
jgi:uncharacterized protein YggT (Ycf19 family)